MTPTTKQMLEDAARRLPLPMAYADPAFKRCMEEAIQTPELIENFDRLYGATLVSRKSPIEAAVDKATGKREEDMRAFCEFVHNSLYMRLPDEAIIGFRAAASIGRRNEVDIDAYIASLDPKTRSEIEALEPWAKEQLARAAGGGSKIREGGGE